MTTEKQIRELRRALQNMLDSHSCCIDIADMTADEFDDEDETADWMRSAEEMAKAAMLINAD